MDKWHKKYGEVDSILDMTELMDDIDTDESFLDPIENSTLGAQATKAGIQTQDLQTVLENFADTLNKAAIAKSTGLPVKTPSAQYKGFAAEEYLKGTMKINALAKGIPNYKFGVYTNGLLPDGSTLSGIDMHSDIVVFVRKWPWSVPKKVASAQVKIHAGKNAAKANLKDMAKPQYEGQEMVFAHESGQGFNDKVHATIGKNEVSSDSITADEAFELAEEMKAQATSGYAQKEEKHRELNKVNLKQAVVTGAITGVIMSCVSEIRFVIANSDNLKEDQFIQSIQNILCGAADGSVRGGAIMGSVQVVGKILGKEIPTNTLGAVPVMAAANASVDIAKDMYNCFIKKTIDTDDLLCNTVNSAFTSVAGMGGNWAGGVAGQLITGSIVASAKAAVVTGASIGSALGPIGTVIGSAIGGYLIGLGANAVIKVGDQDAEKAFTECIADINKQVELEGYEKLYYFCDSMAELSEFKLSFKNLLPCYNLISDLKEYNIRKKAIRRVHEQLDTGFAALDEAKMAALKRLEKEYEQRLSELKAYFIEQRDIMYDGFNDSVRTYVVNSYIQYMDLYSVWSQNSDALVEELHHNIALHSEILNYSRNRNAVNKELNNILEELMEYQDDKDILRPFVDRVMAFMKQDVLLLGRQYISYEEALYMVKGALNG